MAQVRSLFPKIIHSLSHRKHGQFIAINCGAIPEGTIDSELFGHEKGAFTGAHESRKGYFEVTNGGTIFLDEIGEMPVSTQARLLRVLENGEFIKVGSSKVQKTDVRVIAATNVDLTDAIDKNKFREDLYYRLNTVPIHVPALRERGEDVVLLFRKFAADFSENYSTKPVVLDDEAKEVLMKFRFPGNIRQLKNLVEQMSVLEMDREISAETLLNYLPKTTSYLPALANKQEDKENFSERDILYKVLFDMKRDMSEMKTLIHQILSEDSSRSEILSEHQRLFSDVDSIPNTNSSDYSEPEQPPIKPIMLESHRESNSRDEERDYEIEDITHETEDDDSLSLEKKRKGDDHHGTEKEQQQAKAMPLETWGSPKEHCTERLSNMRLIIFSGVLIGLVGLAGCGVYGFTGASISPDVKTISIGTFYNNATLGPSNMSVLFTEAIKDYYQQNTSLTLVDENGDLQLEGYIADYTITPVSASASGNNRDADFSSNSRITVSVSCSYINTKDDEFDFDRKFSFFVDYDQNNTDLASEEQAFVEEIFDQIILDIFNDSVANW